MLMDELWLTSSTDSGLHGATNDFIHVMLRDQPADVG